MPRVLDGSKTRTLRPRSMRNSANSRPTKSPPTIVTVAFIGIHNLLKDRRAEMLRSMCVQRPAVSISWANQDNFLSRLAGLWPNSRPRISSPSKTWRKWLPLIFGAVRSAPTAIITWSGAVAMIFSGVASVFKVMVIPSLSRECLR